MKKLYRCGTALLVLALLAACTPLPDLGALTEAIGRSDNPVDPSNPEFLAAPVITQPIVITNNSVTLSWTAVSKASGYYVYKKSGSDPSLTITKDPALRRDAGTNLSWTEESLDSTKYWAFIVTAKKDQDTDGLPCAMILVAPAPTGLYNSAGILAWYWPQGADMVNHTGSTQHFAILEGMNLTTEFTLRSTAAVVSNGTYMGDGTTAPIPHAPFMYYQVAHKSSLSGPIDGFLSEAAVY